jgi:hypothetical protein
MRIRYENHRTLVTLTGSVRLRLKIRWCETLDCPRFHKPYRPEAEGALALPQHEFGLDIIALVGALRHREHRSVPEIHAVLMSTGVEASAFVGLQFSLPDRRGRSSVISRLDDPSMSLQVVDRGALAPAAA